MQGIKGASLSEKGLIPSITGGSGIDIIVCMVKEHNVVISRGSVMQVYRH